MEFTYLWITWAQAVELQITFAVSCYVQNHSPVGLHVLTYIRYRNILSTCFVDV